MSTELAIYIGIMTGSLVFYGLAIFLLWTWIKRKRHHSIESLLVEEICGLQMQATALALEIARRVNAKEDFDARFFQTYRLSEPLVYPSLGAELRWLRRRSFARIGFFYAKLADARERLKEARKVGNVEPSPYRLLACLVTAVNTMDPWINDLKYRPIYMPDRDNAAWIDANALCGEYERSNKEPILNAYCWTDCAETE